MSLTILITSWLLPALIAAATGLYHGARPAHSAKAFGKDVIFMLMVATPLIFMLQLAWLAALMMADGAISALAGWSLYWTGITALIWVPIMVICYIIRAMRVRG